MPLPPHPATQGLHQFQALIHDLLQLIDVATPRRLLHQALQDFFASLRCQGVEPIDPLPERFRGGSPVLTPILVPNPLPRALSRQLPELIDHPLPFRTLPREALRL